MTRLPAIFALCLSLAACGGNDAGTTTTTKLDAVEVQPGTISDALITLDDTDIDGTAVDNRVPADDTAKVETQDEAGASDDAVATDGEPANPDAVPLPAARKALNPTPTKTEYLALTQSHAPVRLHPQPPARVRQPTLD